MKTILFGIHNKDILEMYAGAARMCGYEPEIARTPEEMPRLAQENRYDVVVMDVNFGNPESEDIEVGEKSWNSVKDRVGRGEARFMSFSGNFLTVEKAKQAGIPCASNKAFKITDFLKGVK